MQHVSIVLTRSNHWYGKVIRWITKSNVNHAFISYYSKQWGGAWAVDVAERGVVKIPLELALKNCEYKEVYYLNNVDLGTAMPKFRNYIGVNYDWWGIVGFFFKILAWRLFGRKFCNLIQRKDRHFCSESVVIFMQNAENAPSWILELDPSTVAPGGTCEFLGVPSLQQVLQKHVVTDEVVWEKSFRKSQ